MEGLSIQCAICLELPVDPVTTACGHNYCMTCLSQWKQRKMECPECKQKLAATPLKINIALRDIIALISKSNAVVTNGEEISKMSAEEKNTYQDNRSQDRTEELSADCTSYPVASTDCKSYSAESAAASAPSMPMLGPAALPAVAPASVSRGSYVGSYLSRRSSDSLGSEAPAAQSVSTNPYVAGIQREQINASNSTMEPASSGHSSSYVQGWLQQQNSLRK